MPRATVTSRVLKNKETGIEIYVPTFRQTKEFMTSVIHYQVVVVSNLSCFKTPNHKESDVVQFSIERKWNEFEDMRNKLLELFSGTVLPPINKKSIIANDVVLRERRNSLDHLMKIIGSTPKLSTCFPLVNFLGVDSVRATKFSRGEPLDTKRTASAEPQEDDGNEDGAVRSQDPIVFGEDDDDSGNEEDLFSDDYNVDDTDLFGADENDSRAGTFKVFEGQDMKRELNDEDENDFTFIPNAILTKKEMVRQPIATEDGENSDLLNIEDDLDKLMTVNKEKRKETVPVEKENLTAKIQSTTPKISTKPSVPAKPKPQIPGKPQIASKPNLSSTGNSPKPSLPQKPKPSPPSKPSTDSKNDPVSTGAVDDHLENLGQDDIMKYLQDNLESNSEEVDLFS